ncbi:MAG: tetratricopeptide repeat protein [Bryobacterales bacterium]
MRAISILALLCTGPLLAQNTVERGVDLFARGEYAQAEKAFADLSSPRAKAFLAMTRAALGRCADVEQHLSVAYRSAALQPADRRLAGLALARCSTAAQRFADSARTLYALQEQFPDDADILYETARLHLKAFNGSVEQMFQHAPASYRVNQLSAEIFEIQGRASEAVAEYRKALEKAPPRTLNLHYRLGRALLMESHEPAALEAARKEFEAELALNPNDPVAEYQVAQILQVQQKPDQAATRLERAIELDPNFAEALIALSRNKLDRNDAAGAIALLEKAVALAPKSESAHYSLMIAYRNAGRRDDAKRMQQRLDALQNADGGEFNQFLQRIGEAPQP